MLRLGITLILLGAFALVLPMFGRQLIVVALLRESGLAIPLIATTLIAVGSLLCYRSSMKGGSTRHESLATLARETRTGRKFWWMAIAAVLVVVAMVWAKRYQPTHREEPPHPFAPRPKIPGREDLIAEQIAKDHQAISLPGGDMTLESAISPAHQQLRLKIVFRSKSRLPVLEGSVARALMLARPTLCGELGLIHKFQLQGIRLTLSAYEGEAPVGEIPVPSTFCL